MEKFICIHGHFYQPPRENPWLEEVEVQESAHPFHDWNEKVMSECYGPNGRSRILGARNQVTGIVNNYSQMSFNFGPTLLDWMAHKFPGCYQTILEADKKSRERFSGHGSALAQAYNHMILPLASMRDRYTQVAWGIRDFEVRFGRRPEGMWLPETAVDLESLDMMAEQGIAFTILSPYQAAKVREGDGEWHDVAGGRVNTRIPYRVNLPSGRSIAIFFYDAPISQGIAFEGLLKSGTRFARRLSSAFDNTPSDQLIHIATDGESYGHHHRFGDMALAYAVDFIEKHQLGRITNYGEFLASHPPTWEAEIIRKSAWSCPHGVDRWWRHCGCNSGGRKDWNQNWREPLRQSLDWLRDTVGERFEQEARHYLHNPWRARNEYIDVILNRSRKNVLAFLEREQLRELGPEEKVKVLQLLEGQRHSMLMYTSCGWFFDDISGIETVQCLQYAGRVIQLTKKAHGYDPEGEFLERLSNAKSNIEERGDGRQIYERCVKPAVVDFESVGAHFAISSIFEKFEDETKVFCYSVKDIKHQEYEAGIARLVIGKAEIRSVITWDMMTVAYASIHLGGHTVNAGVRHFEDQEMYEKMAKEAENAFLKADFGEVFRALDRHFGSTAYSLTSLFKDQQRKILGLVLGSVIQHLEEVLERLYGQHTPVMRFLNELKIPLPRVYQSIAEFTRNANIKELLLEEEIDFDQLAFILGEVKKYKLNIEGYDLPLNFQNALERLMQYLKGGPRDVTRHDAVLRMLSIISESGIGLDTWKSQNIYFEILGGNEELQAKGRLTDTEDWIGKFREIGNALNVRPA